MKARTLLGAALIMLALALARGEAAAQARTRTLLSTSAKVLVGGAGVKAGASCKVQITTDSASGCSAACAATITCGKQVFDLGPNASCEPPDPYGDEKRCETSFKKQVFTATGRGWIAAADGLGLAMNADQSEALVLQFAGGRQRNGDPEGKPTYRVKGTRTIASFDGALPLKARTCSIEMGVRVPPLDHPCDNACLVKIACGTLRWSRWGTCTVPYRYTSGGGCFGTPAGMAFRSDDLELLVDPDPDNTNPVGTIDLFGLGSIVLSR